MKPIDTFKTVQTTSHQTVVKFNAAKPVATVSLVAHASISVGTIKAKSIFVAFVKTRTALVDERDAKLTIGRLREPDLAVAFVVAQSVDLLTMCIHVATMLTGKTGTDHRLVKMLQTHGLHRVPTALY